MNPGPHPTPEVQPPAPWWCAGPVTLYTGDAHDVLAAMPDASVDCIVTSPPYWGMRRYRTGAWQGGHPGCGHEAATGSGPHRLGQTGRCPACGAVWVDRQYGLEPTLTAYIQHLVAVFAQARRVLHPAGTLWLNLGDTYACGQVGRADAEARYPSLGASQPHRAGRRVMQRSGVPPKNLLGVPWRVALALQANNWILRNAVVWSKNAMPQSVRDRLSTTYELVFLLTRSPRYYFDLDAIRVPLTHPTSRQPASPPDAGQPHRPPGTGPRPRGRDAHGRGKYDADPQVFAAGVHGAAMRPGRPHNAAHPLGKNPGDVWRMATRPLKEAHFAAFPVDIPLRCIAAGCRPGGVVLDPFSGAGTTGLAALHLGRRYIGVDLSSQYAAIARRRLSPHLNLPDTGEAADG
jgi:site-specific DNA-methyltransferase (cytosine-N4-specific)